MPTTHGEQASTINRDSQAYWNKRAATFTRDTTVEYERWLLDLLALKAGEEILDMGCATGTLAVPLARAGHRVHGCDFAEAMLAILDERTAAENLPITSHLLAWEDDWDELGLGENSVDVAFASRSLMSGNVFSAVHKLDAAARSRAAVVVPDSLLPSRDPRLLTYLGRSARHPRVVREVTRALTSLGRVPVFATTRTFRPMRFSSFDEARSDLRRLAGPEPFTAREQRLFDAYAEQHFVREDAATSSEKARERWLLDYPLPVTWVFIGWSTDGRAWA
ncbi:class I SAM-dependent methyltransferase [Pauljensenia sp. UMB0018B]|uniref:Class I SAM-dependent methyltransferase n=1 Tax=Schaalia odontolytica TaxID=1660 RepID=A0A2I1I1E1_9ACTO|nr:MULTISPECIES: class I SAM-dependent methyltransferase [Actinomycetaceae]MDK7340109.1 class I SAM-dependent methyltransferase [Pauljensenia sp. UMB0018B]PKY64935.1 class I SAM-dependent methyltransferase [Schaalia odontolytica]